MCSQFCRKLWPHLRLNKQEDGSHGDFDHRFRDRCRNRFTMLFQTFKVALNSVANVHHCFVTSFPLRDAARQSRAFSDKYAVFVWFNRDAKFHVASLPIAAAALARARWLQATRKAFISARSTTIRVAMPLYFFVIPVTVRLTAPWLTRR